jgi:hypothetical protein
MKRVLLIALLTLVILPQVLAINVTVESSSNNPLIVSGFNTPVEFDLTITNNGPTDTFRLYNVLGFTMTPTEEFEIKEEQSKGITLMISPRENFDPRGNYVFNYYIKSTSGEETQDGLKIKIIDFQDVFEIGSSELVPENNEIKVYLRNRENFRVQALNVKMSSPFFDFEETLDMEPNQTTEFTVKLNEEDFKELVAGFYTLRAELSASGEEASIEGVIKFPEKGDLTTTRTRRGIFIRTTTIKNVNDGNTIISTESEISKNIISKFFTSFSPTPDNKEGTFFPKYTWNTEVKPNETEEIKATTNWLYPILIIILVILAIKLLNKYAGKDVVVRKRVSFVKTKGGEFAVKIKIYLHAKKYVERVSAIDRLPKFLSIHPRFGSEEPIRVDEQNKRVEWGFEKLEAGETRVLTYVSFSKLGVMGRFILPRTTVIYEKEGVVKESKSNKTFFVAEHKKGEKEE